MALLDYKIITSFPESITPIKKKAIEIAQYFGKKL